VEAVEVEFAGPAGRLSGTITLPDTAPPSPGVLLIGGSGPSDRHSGGFFDLLRDHLAGAGLAVLAYDKRGAGRSAGDWPAATVDDLAADAAAAMAALRAHPQVAAEPVGLLGHSEGGWVALRVCARLGEPRYLIMSSCPAVSFAESEVHALTGAGAPPGRAAELMQRLTAAVQAGHGYQEGQRILAACQDEPWYAALAAGGFRLDARTWSGLGAWGQYDPGDDLGQLTTPTLAIFGGGDPLVPVPASVARLRETGGRTARPQQITVFPGADHRLQAGTGLVAGYLTCLSTWCRAGYRSAPSTASSQPNDRAW
jgi:pimeloyl-ACP methyl ester carboxylesterase